MYIKYNDYELLYYIEDGCEIAFDILMKKYFILAEKMASKYARACHYKEDLTQEGLMVVWNCVKHFDQRKNVPFYSFVRVCIERRYMSLCKNNNYYQNTNFLSEDCIDYSSKNHYLFNYKKLLNNDLDRLIYKECFIENFTITYFCSKYSYNYSYIYSRYVIIKNKLKNILTN